jgi:hypothetical protein
MIPFRPQKLDSWNQVKLAVLEALALAGVRDSIYTAALKKRLKVENTIKRNTKINKSDGKYAVQDSLGGRMNAALGTNFKGGHIGGLRPGRGPWLMLDGSDLRRYSTILTIHYTHYTHYTDAGWIGPAHVQYTMHCTIHCTLLIHYTGWIGSA